MFCKVISVLTSGATGTFLGLSDETLRRRYQHMAAKGQNFDFHLGLILNEWFSNYIPGRVPKRQLDI